MIVSEIYSIGDDLFSVVLNMSSAQVKPIRVVSIELDELNPVFFEEAMCGFPNAKPYDSKMSLNFLWGFFERKGHLIATVTNKGGFVIHENQEANKSIRKIFSKQARMKYERSISA